MNRDELKEYFRKAYSGLLKEQDDPFATDDEGGDEGGDEEEGGDEAEDEGGDEGLPRQDRGPLPPAPVPVRPPPPGG